MDRSSASELAIFRWIVTRLTSRTRFLIVVIGACALVGRLTALAAAWLFASDHPRAALVIGALSGAAFIARRAANASARVEVECDLHMAAARAVLAADVLEEPEVEPHFALGNGLYYAMDAVTSAIPSFAADVVSAVVAAVVLAATVGSVLSPQLAVVAVVAVLVVGGTTLLVRRWLGRLHEEAIAMQETLNDALASALHGRLEIVASGAESPALHQVAEAARAFRRQATRAAFGAAVIGRAPLGAALVFCAIAIAMEPNIQTWISATPALAIVAAALPPILGVIFGSQELLRLVKHLAPFARIVLRPDRPEIVRRESATAQIRLPRPFELERVEFSYQRGGARVLDGFEAVWRSGVLVLRGPNGSGKSTALRLLLGLREPTAGVVRLGEVDLRRVDLPRTRARIAYLPQRPYLGESYKTIADAFRLLTPDATPDVIHAALARVGLVKQLAHRGPDVLALTVGELSVGQRQRLAIARVLARSANIVLLDEPDANLDRDGIELLAEIVTELAREGRMVAVAAHGPIAARLDGEVWEFTA